MECWRFASSALRLYSFLTASVSRLPLAASYDGSIIVVPARVLPSQPLGAIPDGRMSDGR